MLPRGQRLTAPAEFRTVVRRGRRAGGELMVVHATHSDTGAPAPGRAGFIVSKAVGDAVTRNQVKRRLRHLMAERLDDLPDRLVVVRALSGARGATSAELSRELDRCLERVR